MTPTDAGALVALINRRDKAHAACTDAVKSLPKPLVTTRPCLGEAMYLLGTAGGNAFRERLWRLIKVSPIAIHLHSTKEFARMRELMKQYKNVPMDLADASLVAMSETLHARRIFIVDGDFYVYRLADGRALRVIP